jgi:Tol biopolymer transport system component
VHRLSRLPRAGRGLGLLGGALLLAVFAGPVRAQAEPPQPGWSESDFLRRSRQLTFEGRRAGEGYFNLDGSQMVFQSERETGNPFYQIYVMDLETGDTRRISPGQGKTTCAFFQPGTGRIVFASTHHDPRSLELQQAEYARRAEGKQRRYSWDYDPEMELYVYEPATEGLRRLTHVRGYDAEASYSPNGKWIVFTSVRSGYEEELDEREKRRFEIDPSYHAEIYRMRSDGSGVKRLTQVPGYDGGPFFSPNGKKIVWRRFDEEGLIAEVWTMDRDGTDQRQLTDLGSMSWAPYFHPSGKYIFFTSNKFGFSNFELFIVDAEGRKQPVRITYTDGFDGLPVPTPDGKRLTWTSTRRNQGKGQIFIADWNHERALEALRQSPERRSEPQGRKR